MAPCHQRLPKRGEGFFAMSIARLVCITTENSHCKMSFISMNQNSAYTILKNQDALFRILILLLEAMIVIGSLKDQIFQNTQHLNRNGPLFIMSETLRIYTYNVICLCLRKDKQIVANNAKLTKTFGTSFLAKDEIRYLRKRIVNPFVEQQQLHNECVLLYPLKCYLLRHYTYQQE